MPIFPMCEQRMLRQDCVHAQSQIVYVIIDTILIKLISIYNIYERCNVHALCKEHAVCYDLHFKLYLHIYVIEQRHEISNNVVCATSKASYQLAHTLHLSKCHVVENHMSRLIC